LLLSFLDPGNDLFAEKDEFAPRARLKMGQPLPQIALAHSPWRAAEQIGDFLDGHRIAQGMRKQERPRFLAASEI